MKSRIVAAVIGTALQVAGMPNARACGADVECKGDRVCDNQVCVSPSPPNAVGACRADVDCPADNLCSAGVCALIPASSPAGMQAPVMQAPPPQAPVELRPPAPAWQYNGTVPPPRPYTNPPLVMRNPRLRNAGVALVTIGVIMEVVGLGLSVAAPCEGPAFASRGGLRACVQASVASDLLVGLGLPVLANGAWMWPVGGKLVPENQASGFSVVPYVSSFGDGGAFGMKLTFF